MLARNIASPSVPPGLRAKIVVCGHEAAHAVLGAIFGMRVAGLSVRPRLRLSDGRVRFGECRLERADGRLHRRAAALVALAGGAQDRRAGVRPRLGSDLARAEQLLGSDVGMLPALARGAARLVDEHQGTIVRLAEALVQAPDGRLDEYAIKFLLGKVTTR